MHKYFTVYQPKGLVFEGKKDETYGASSMERGTDLRYIQNLLGHESIKTTGIYTHITNKGLDKIENPLDDMELSENRYGRYNSTGVDTIML